MKFFTSTSLILGAAMFLLGCGEQLPGSSTLETRADSVAYVIGTDIGRSLTSDPTVTDYGLDAAMVYRGLRDVMESRELTITQEEAQSLMMAFQRELNDLQTERMKEVGEKNKAEGEAFLAENQNQEGVLTTESGLQYKIIEEGEGTPPTADQTVTVHYRGTLIDGTEFDSSYSRGVPATFGVSEVIPGWTEALQMMKPGAKWELYVPSELAYGERGSGPQIGPYATLIFEVELMEVE